MSLLSLSSSKSIVSHSSKVSFNRGLASLWPIKNPFKKSSETKSVDELPLQPIDPEPKALWEHLNDEQIAKICDRSGLDDESKELERRQLFGPVKFYQLRKYKRENVKKFYAYYGRDSGLKPGVCWPNVEEADFYDKFEKTFYPSLEKLMADNEAEKQRIAAIKKEREDLVTKGLAQRDELIAQFYEKRAVKLAEEEEAKKRNEKLVAQVREYLGFNIEKSDPRFQEALAKKEEEERAKAKAATKKDKNAKLAAMLQKMLDLPKDEIKSSEKQPETKTDKSVNRPKDEKTE
ncbi:growth arrest and DNA damage-inducible proteins-interacting protein 1-like [Panonychus citri]|uniref:growth arrest and DNA damage-inducible proteins-interacting protein 1-like n=1 Tax=Panonychus citri TaxID=50023 RepID=UPI0023074982|nr:growth arrest and DNA damage-inducible proteins-interacting protein 1-like [Panonychus citri]